MNKARSDSATPLCIASEKGFPDVVKLLLDAVVRSSQPSARAPFVRSLPTLIDSFPDLVSHFLQELGLEDAEGALDLKQQADGEFRKQDFELAIKTYTRSIDLDNSNSAAYANRCAARIQLKRFEEALEDARASSLGEKLDVKDPHWLFSEKPVTGATLWNGERLAWRDFDAPRILAKRRKYFSDGADASELKTVKTTPDKALEMIRAAIEARLETAPSGLRRAFAFFDRDGSGDMDGGRHYTVWEDPFPKPSSPIGRRQASRMTALSGLVAHFMLVAPSGCSATVAELC